MNHYTSTIALPLDLPKEVVLDVEGGELTSDSGLLLLAQADRKIGLTRMMADAVRKSLCVSKSVIAVSVPGTAKNKFVSGYRAHINHNSNRRPPCVIETPQRLRLVAPDIERHEIEISHTMTIEQK